MALRARRNATAQRSQENSSWDSGSSPGADLRRLGSQPTAVKKLNRELNGRSTADHPNSLIQKSINPTIHPPGSGISNDADQTRHAEANPNRIKPSEPVHRQYVVG